MSSPVCLLDVLATVPDPRDKRGVRHPLTAVLGLAVLAMLTGCKGYEAIAQFGRDKGFALAHALGFRRGKTPTKSTYSVLFRRIDVVAFEAALGRWIATRLSPEPASVIALDGKTLRGSKDGPATTSSPRMPRPPPPPWHRSASMPRRTNTRRR